MNITLEKWVAECLANGTFRSRNEMIEFCVGATKLFCEQTLLTQVSMRERCEKKKIPIPTFPIDYEWLMEEGLVFLEVEPVKKGLKIAQDEIERINP